MRVLIDEDVPRAIASFLSSRSHDVAYVVDVLTPGVPDTAVASYADTSNRIVVTFNLRDYNRLIMRTAPGKQVSLPHAGLLGFQCDHPVGRDRIAELIRSVEHEHAFLQRMPSGDQRLIVQVTNTILKIIR